MALNLQEESPAMARSTARIVKVEQPRYDPAEQGLRDPCEVSHGAMGRSIPRR
jgi:hypothetical protein